MASVIKKKKRIPSKIPYFATGIYGAFYLMQMNFTSIREWITLGIGSVLIYFISTKIFRGKLVEYEVPVQYEDMSVQEILSTGNLYMDSFEKKRKPDIIKKHGTAQKANTLDQFQKPDPL